MFSSVAYIKHKDFIIITLILDDSLKKLTGKEDCLQNGKLS